MRPKSIEKWEKSTIIVCVSLIIISTSFYYTKCLTQHYDYLFSIINSLASGLIGAIFILYLQRKHKTKELERVFKKFEGDYERINMGNDNKSKADNKQMREQNIGLKMSWFYKDQYSFQLNVEYWRTEENKKSSVIAHIEFDKTDNYTALGKYYYIDKEGDKKGHFGTYKIFMSRNTNDLNNTLIILFQHLYPRNLEGSPDDNRGWEQWKKTSAEPTLNF